MRFPYYFVACNLLLLVSTTRSTRVTSFVPRESTTARGAMTLPSSSTSSSLQQTRQQHLPRGGAAGGSRSITNTRNKKRGHQPSLLSASSSSSSSAQLLSRAEALAPKLGVLTSSALYLAPHGPYGPPFNKITSISRP